MVCRCADIRAYGISRPFRFFIGCVGLSDFDAVVLKFVGDDEVAPARGAFAFPHFDRDPCVGKVSVAGQFRAAAWAANRRCDLASVFDDLVGFPEGFDARVPVFVAHDVVLPFDIVVADEEFDSLRFVEHFSAGSPL